MGHTEAPFICVAQNNYNQMDLTTKLIKFKEPKLFKDIKTFRWLIYCIPMVSCDVYHSVVVHVRASYLQAKLADDIFTLWTTTSLCFGSDG